MNGSAFVLVINYIAKQNYRQCFFAAFFSVQIKIFQTVKRKKVRINNLPGVFAGKICYNENEFYAKQNIRKEKNMSKLLLLVEYTAKQGERGAFLEEVQAAGILEKIYAEDGFLKYAYYLDAADADKILLVEEWASEEDQQKHLQTAHMAQLKVIKEKHVLSTTLQKVLVP